MNALTNYHWATPSSVFCNTHKIQKQIVANYEFCPECAKQDMDLHHKQHAEELKNKILSNRMSAAMLPRRHAECGFTNFKISNAGQRNALNQCARYAKDYLAGHNRNLAMTGSTGTGKTHLACAVARNVLDRNLIDRHARYITSADMADTIADAWKKTDDSEAAAVFRFTEYDLLILDEYGLHDQHENRLKLVHKVLYARYDAQKPTMIISNMTTEELAKNLGDRLWSRFQHDGLTVVECNWKDQRVGGVV